jgi:hypothetical protein
MMRINSKAAVKRIPVGTKLMLVHTLLGPTHSPREVVQVKSNHLVMRREDNQLSYLYLDQTHETVEATERGFRIVLNEAGSKQIAAEYTFL